MFQTNQEIIETLVDIHGACNVTGYDQSDIEAVMRTNKYRLIENSGPHNLLVIVAKSSTKFGTLTEAVNHFAADDTDDAGRAKVKQWVLKHVDSGAIEIDTIKPLTAN